MNKLFLKDSTVGFWSFPRVKKGLDPAKKTFHRHEEETKNAVFKDLVLMIEMLGKEIYSSKAGSRERRNT